MNLGNRRLKNDELCDHFAAMAFSNVGAFLASGNIVFETDGQDRQRVGERIETGLHERLGYDVPTFIRSGREVVAITESGPFRDERGAQGGKPQVMLLPSRPAATARKRVLALATEDDQLAFDGCELHWLPTAGISTSELDLRSIEKSVGPTTTRTRNTLERLVAKFLA